LIAGKGEKHVRTAPSNLEGNPWGGKFKSSKGSLGKEEKRLSTNQGIKADLSPRYAKGTARGGKRREDKCRNRGGNFESMPGGFFGSSGIVIKHENPDKCCGIARSGKEEIRLGKTPAVHKERKGGSGQERGKNLLGAGAGGEG